MALKSDDFDIRKTWLRCQFGGNGDCYIEIFSEDDKGIITSSSVRIAMSGGNAPHKVKLAVAKLTRSMGYLNTHPDEINPLTKGTLKCPICSNQLLFKQMYGTRVIENDRLSGYCPVDKIYYDVWS